jgi:hypothetical protein
VECSARGRRLAALRPFSKWPTCREQAGATTLHCSAASRSWKKRRLRRKQAWQEPQEEEMALSIIASRYQVHPPFVRLRL